MKAFTKEELRRYNGKNGAPAYVACRGMVYDVSNSSLWRNGRHQILHYAGQDLTEALEQAPHGIEMLEKFPLVGRLHHE